MPFVIQDISVHYARVESNLDLNVETCQCLMVEFDVWLEKLSQNAPQEKKFFLRCFLLKFSWR